MNLNIENLKESFGKMASPSLPEGLEERVLLAVHNEQRREEALSRRFWNIGVAVSVFVVFVGIATSWQSLNANGLFEILQTALANLSALRPSDIFWGLIESLPLNSLALTFCAATALGWLASIKKPNRQHLLFFKFI